VIQTLGVKPRNVVTAVGGRDVIVKKIEMDRMPGADAREVIRWEAEQYVPFDMENVQLDFQILDPEGEGLRMSVLLVAAKRDLVEQRLMLLADAEISPSVVDVDAFALFNAFEFNYPGASRGIGVLVDIGHEVATVIVYQDSVPVVTRDVPFGSRQLREELRRMHGLSADEAESVIRGNSSREAEFGKLLHEKASELAGAIERATGFLTMDGGGEVGISAIYLSGGGARIPRLHEALTDRLHARLEVVNPLQRLDIAPEATAEITEDESSIWMLPVGLALRAEA
jgi:type IV pilus assembly protein PilM